jgi:ribose/xylose/arabinose/galactoside ABC-type transport system permease subunit
MYVELDAILAVVIGGTSMNGGKFNLLGSLVGALIIQSLTTTIFTKGVPVQLTLVVKAAVVVIVILLQSGEFRRQLGALVPGRAAR